MLSPCIENKARKRGITRHSVRKLQRFCASVIVLSRGLWFSLSTLACTKPWISTSRTLEPSPKIKKNLFFNNLFLLLFQTKRIRLPQATELVRFCSLTCECTPPVCVPEGFRTLHEVEKKNLSHTNEPGVKRKSKRKCENYF